jgi:hypothetical protein
MALKKFSEVEIPYGMFASTANQLIANTTLAQAITFNTDIYKYRITHSTTVNNSRVTVDDAGAYLIVVSAICDETAADLKHLEIWLAVNGSNIANSNTIVQLPTKDIEMVLAVSFIQTFTAGQYFELYMRGDSTTLRLKTTAAGTTPTRPASPSIIITVNKISR